MTSATNSNQQAQVESKSAKKKKAKAEIPNKDTSAPSDGDTGGGQATTEGTTNGADGAYESPYLKELYKYVLLRISSDEICIIQLLTFLIV